MAGDAAQPRPVGGAPRSPAADHATLQRGRAGISAARSRALKSSQFLAKAPTMAPVFGLSNLSRRLVESVVGLFAILGFLYVPLGRHTGFEHAKAVFSTPAAAAAIDDVTTTALGLRQRALDFVTGRMSVSPG